MGAEVVERVFPPALRARLGRSVRLAPRPLTGPLDSPGAADVLAATEILVTGWSCPPLTPQVLSCAPRLKAVVHAAGSVRPLVTDAVWERGLLVSSAADANAGPVVAFTVAAVTFAVKNALATAARYADAWPRFDERSGADGRTVGVIGASRIGRRVIEALRADAAGYRILLCDPYVDEAGAARLGAELTDLAGLCRRSAVVSVHAPELPETRGLVSAGMLRLIPDGGTLINTARGALVDTDALAAECATGRLSAFLDVTEPEPLPAGHPLLALPNVLVTPHIAGAQGTEVERLGRYAVEEVERYVTGRGFAGRTDRGDLARVA
ncbi:hydroxyacid dehydrogenase [Streptomyces sp. NPDC001904]|uniref:hydroxyacid dehydrogenase n=1 Tax=Streptomyces sp. NPDC001904 TaxID=3154531 RepID=UPI003318C976